MSKSRADFALPRDDNVKQCQVSAQKRQSVHNPYASSCKRNLWTSETDGYAHFVLSPSVDNLVAQLTRLPGIGSRTAQRLAFHILSAGKEEASAPSEELSAAARMPAMTKPDKPDGSSLTMKLANSSSLLFSPRSFTGAAAL